MKSVIAVVFFSSLLLVAGPAAAGERFRCGDGSAGIGMRIAIEPENGVGQFDGVGRSGRLTPDGQGGWVNRDIGVGFYPEELPPVVYLGSEQFSCENEAAIQPDAGEAGSSFSEETDLNLRGQSLGGNVRQGPGTDYPSLGKLTEGRPIIIVSRSPVVLDGYNWFRIALTDGQTGYQWGGIMCSDSEQIPGIYQACGKPPQ